MLGLNFNQGDRRKPMPASTDELFALFDQLGIAHETVEHPAIFTVEEGRDWHDKIPGLHCKNFFMEDKKGEVWLVTLPADKRGDIGRIQKSAGAAKLSFGKPDLMEEVLGITPGSVTPFALINDKSHRCHVILDTDMMQSELANYHPLRNTASTCIKSADLLKFIRHLGFEALIFDCGKA
jgi:Ala-tRNA(Pro) deacylase